MTREPGKQFIPTFVRDAGNQMLVMLWLVVFLYHLVILLKLSV